MQIKCLIKKLGLTFIGIIIFQTIFAQENYLSGYIINLKGDTIRGFVDYRNWGTNPGSISFKENIDNNQAIYKPSDISEFSVMDEVYVSGLVKIETSSRITNTLDTDSKLHIKEISAFLQTLVKGDKNLYYYKESDGNDNFYIKQDSKYTLLMYKKYILVYNSNQRVKRENKAYIGQLTVYFNDCPTIQSKINSATYNQKSLIKLFQSYYECVNTDILFQRKVEKISTQLGLLTGISMSSINFTGDEVFNYVISADYNQSTNFSGGIFYDIILPRNQGKWSINNELIYTSYKVNGQSKENSTFNSLSTIELGYSYIKINNMLRFKYPIGSLYFYLNGGMTNGFVVSETNYRKKVTTINSTTETIDESKALDETRKYEQGYVVGIGAKYNKFSFEIRYEKGNGISEYNYLASKTKRYYFLLGYRF